MSLVKEDNLKSTDVTLGPDDEKLKGEQKMEDGDKNKKEGDPAKEAGAEGVPENNKPATTTTKEP